MTGEHVPHVAAPREGLATQLRQLEAFVARTESEGTELPPEAREMIDRLREIMEALDGLSSTLGTPPVAGERGEQAIPSPDHT